MAAAEGDGTISYLYRQRWPIALSLSALLIAAAAVYYVSPLLDGIVFGVFFAYVTRPIKGFLGRYTRFAPLLATCCIVLPILLLCLFAAIEIKGQADSLSLSGGDLQGRVNVTLQSLGATPEIVSRANDALANAAGYLAGLAKAVPIGETFGRLILFGTNALISVFVCYYLLKDGDTFISTVTGLVPPEHRHAVDYFVREADRILSSIYVGTFYTAAFIALLTAVLLFLFGIPHLALLTAFVFLAAMVPILSGMMVFLPLSAYLYVDRGPVTAAAFLVLSVVFVYLPPDFLVRPYLISRTSDIHPLLIILSFIGGGLAGGLSGFFAAPLVVGLMVAVYRTYLQYGRAVERPDL